MKAGAIPASVSCLRRKSLHSLPIKEPANPTADRPMEPNPNYETEEWGGRWGCSCLASVYGGLFAPALGSGPTFRPSVISQSRLEFSSATRTHLRQKCKQPFAAWAPHPIAIHGRILHPAGVVPFPSFEPCFGGAFFMPVGCHTLGSSAVLVR
jgi:hypothetical protein